MLATAASTSLTPLPLRVAGASISGATATGRGAFSALAGGGAVFGAGDSLLTILSALSVFSVLTDLSYLSFLPGFSALADLSGTTAVFSSTAGRGGVTMAAGVGAGGGMTGAGGGVGSATGAGAWATSRREAMGTICARMALLGAWGGGAEGAAALGSGGAGGRQGPSSLEQKGNSRQLVSPFTLPFSQMKMPAVLALVANGRTRRAILCGSRNRAWKNARRSEERHVGKE